MGDEAKCPNLDDCCADCADEGLDEERTKCCTHDEEDE